MRPELAIHVYHPEAAAPIAELVRARAGSRRVVALHDEAELAEALADIEVLFAPRPPRAGWSTAQRLRLVQLAGVGADHLLPSPDLPPSVEVAGLRGLFADAVAEHVLTVLLAIARELPGFLADAAARRWRQRPVPLLRGRTITVLGLGAIGQAIVGALHAQGLRLRGVCRRPRRVPHVERTFGAEALVDAVSGADALVVAVPRTPSTERLVDARVLGALKDDAIVVDVSRGGVVDASALLDALHAGRLQAACDVFDDEPLRPESPLWDAPRMLITPHVAGYQEGYLGGAVDVLLENVRRLERGEPRERLIDRAAGY